MPFEIIVEKEHVRILQRNKTRSGSAYYNEKRKSENDEKQFSGEKPHGYNFFKPTSDES